MPQDAVAPMDGRHRGAPQRVHPAAGDRLRVAPHLSGAVFRPLKRGIFQDILAATLSCSSARRSRWRWACTPAHALSAKRGGG